MQSTATSLISHLKSSPSEKEDPKRRLKLTKKPDAQSDVHLRGRDVSHKHITTHSGSAQDCFAEPSSDGCVTHVAKANTPSSNRQKAAYTAGAVRTTQSSTKNRRRKRKRVNTKRFKQDEQLIHIELPNSPSIFPNLQSQGSILVVDGGIVTNPPYAQNHPSQTLRIISMSS